MSTPLMQMNDYDMGEILATLQLAGCGQAHVELTDHYESDVARIREWYRSVSNGKNHDA